MRLEGWRKRRRFDETGEGEAESEGELIDLTSREHAWWAARDDVQAVPRGTQGSSRRRGARPAEPSAHRRHAVFQEYFTRESLFDAPTAVDARAGADDPYLVLGLAQTASWEEITAAHRRVAKEHHPDRLVAVSPQQRAISERYMRDANIAYMELRQRRGR